MKSTGGDFQGLRNTCHKRGRYCEDLALEYFKQKEFHLVSRNLRIGGVEIDLLLKREHWLLVEVKSLSRPDDIHFRLKFRQRLRLQRAGRIFENGKTRPVELRLVYVLPSGRIIDLSVEEHF